MNHSNSTSPARRRLRLLEIHDLIKTGPVDHADWNYRPHLGWLQKQRFRLGVRLLPAHSQRLLEIGYGSGILMPELSQHTAELYGIDPHPFPAEVAAKLQQHGIEASLTTGSAERMPYPDAHFDSAIAVSSLEFVPDIEAACREIVRVLQPGGRLIVIVPGHSPVLDLGLRLLTGKSASTDYADRRQRLMPALENHFEVRRWLKFPPLISALLPVYNALELIPQTS